MILQYIYKGLFWDSKNCGSSIHIIICPTIIQIMAYFQVMTIIEKVPQLVKSMTGVDIAKSVGGSAMS